MLRMRVVYFALSMELAKTEEETYDSLGNAMVLTLMEEIVSRLPRLNDERISVAVNRMLVDRSTTLHERDTVADFPMVSGG